MVRISDDSFPPAPVAGIAARALRQLGYRAGVRVLGRAAYDRLPAGERAAVQLGASSWLADFLSPSNFFEPWIACRGTFNDGRVCDPALDRRIDRAHGLEATDPARADALWAAIDRRATDDGLWVPLANGREVELVSRRVGSYQYDALLGFLADQAWVR